MLKRYKLKLLIVGSLLFSGVQVSAQNQEVNSPIDGGGLPGTTDLRTAIANAGAGDTITFAATTNGFPQTLTAGEILIDKPLVIIGNGSGSTLIGAGTSSRIFNIQDADSVLISGITFSDGADSAGGAFLSQNTSLVLDDLGFEDCVADSSGGAIQFTGAAELRISNSTFSNNAANGTAATLGGGAIYANMGTTRLLFVDFDGNTATGTSGSGGAIFLNSGAFFTSDTCTYTNNLASRAGGAIEDRSGSASTATLRGNTFTANTTGNNPGNGGAIHITGDGTMIILGDTYTGNLAAREGGAIWNGSGSMTIGNTLIQGNTASGNAADDGGGGVFNNGGILTIQNNTIINNNLAEGTSGSGGGVFNNTGGNLSIVNSTITNNTAMRAGGGIEDNSGADFPLTLIEVILDSNETAMNPGNGGGLHITGPGNVSITNGTVRANTASAEGGGLWNGSGIMNVVGTQIRNNTASGAAADQGGGGIYNLSGTVLITNAFITGNIADGAAGSGGGILNDAGGELTVTNSEIMKNTAVRAGGGIEDNSGAGTLVTITNVKLDSNSTAAAPGNGGGLHVTGAGDVNITGGTVNGNFAARQGGGLWNGSGNMIVDATRIDGNTASGDDPNYGGGGIYNLSGNLTVQNGAIISNNIADGSAGSGGGILNDTGAGLSLDGVTISGNTAVRAGGGLEDNSGNATTVTISNCTFDLNETAMSPGNGGAIHITGNGNMDITNSDFTGNFASAEGGALWNGAGTMNVSGSNITGNRASGAGADQGGGGIYNLSGILNVTNNTVIENNRADGASGSGGGILNDVGATLSVSTSIIRGNTASRAGGGIEDNSGAATTMTLNNITLESNSTGAAPGNGGGLHITGPGNVDITSGIVRKNTASSEGGGLWNGTGIMTIEGTLIDSNIAMGATATEGGGGIFALRGELIITGAQIRGNIANGASGSGGGILLDSAAAMTMENCVIEGNSASRAGGGIEDNSRITTLITINNSKIDSNRTGSAPGNGGGIHITGNGSMFITNTSAFGNVAAAEGGGFWNGSGTMSLDNCELAENVAQGAAADQGGGALFNQAGTMLVNRCLIHDNIASGAAGSGGGILTDAGTTLEVDSTNFTANISSRAGGAIEDNSGDQTTMIITASNFFDNETGPAPGNGGAIHITGPGNAVIAGGLYRGNIASREGGAIWNGSGEMTIDSITVSNNIANGPLENDGGGGIFNNGGILVINRSTINNNGANTTLGSGGGVHNNAGTMEINFSTISNNQTNGYGAGVYNNGDITILSSTIFRNTTTLNGGGFAQTVMNSTADFSSTILAGNVAVGSGTEFFNQNAMITSSGYNLVGTDDNGTFPLISSDQVGTPANPIDPMLASLANNGGPTFTHAVQCGSAALDNGDPAITDVDQRGEMVFGAARDIGAFERQDICNSVEEFAEQVIQGIYPNPISGSELNLEMKNGQSAVYEIVEAGSGRTVLTGELNGGNNRISIDRLASGMYMLVVRSNGNVETHRISKMR